MIKKILFPITFINAALMAWFIGRINFETIAIHYNIYGNADLYGSKWTLLIFAAIPLALSLVFLIYKRFTKNSANNDAENKIISLITAFFVIIGWIIVFVSSKNLQKLEPWILSSIIAMVGLLITCISLLMPRVKQNRFLGIRTSATLKNEDV